MQPPTSDPSGPSRASVAPDALDVAFAAFETNDVTVAAVLDGAAALGRDLGLPRLREELDASTGTRRARVAERIAKHAASMPQSVLLDELVGDAWAIAGRHGEALEVWRIALGRTPRWHPGLAAGVLTGLGRGFVGLGAADAAVTWLERACAFDPFHPLALAGFIDALSALDDAPHAFAVADHLARCGFDPQLRAGLVEVARPPDVPPFSPDLALLRPLDDAGWARLAAFLAFDPRGRVAESLRVHGLGCAMRGRDGYATLCARAVEGFDDAPPLLHAWARSLSAACAARASARGAAVPSFDLDARLAALAATPVDPDRARDALHDPAIAVRLCAAKRLLLEPAGDPCAQALVAEQASLERARGLDLHPTGELGVTATEVVRARAMAITAARAPHRLPEEGPAHPTFARVRDGELLVVWVEHRTPAVDGAALEAALTPLRTEATIEARVQAEVAELVLRAVVGDARPLLAALVAAVTEGALRAGNPLRTIVLARLAPGADGVLRPVDDPPLRRGHYERIGDEWWHAAFDPRRKAPASEPSEGWSARMPTVAGYVDEARPLRLDVEGVRIVWGLPDLEPPLLPPLRLPAEARAILDRARAHREKSGRALAVAAAIERALVARFEGVPLSVFDRERRPGAIDDVLAGGKRGYGFALEGMCAGFVQHLPGAFRFREHELFLALRDVVRAEGLAPAVHWLRRDGCWLFDLWER